MKSLTGSAGWIWVPGKVYTANCAIRCPLRHSRIINICHKKSQWRTTTYFQVLKGKALGGYATWQCSQVFLTVSQLSEHNMTKGKIFHLWFCTSESSSSECTDRHSKKGQPVFTVKPVDFNTAETYSTQLCKCVKGFYYINYQEIDEYTLHKINVSQGTYRPKW